MGEALAAVRALEGLLAAVDADVLLEKGTRLNTTKTN